MQMLHNSIHSEIGESSPLRGLGFVYLYIGAVSMA